MTFPPENSNSRYSVKQPIREPVEKIEDSSKSHKNCFSASIARARGVIIGRLTEKIGEEQLIAFGPLLLMLGIFLMPLIPNIVIFVFSLTVMSLASGMMRTVVPSFISKISPANEQGGILGVTNGVASIARVPGPLIAGFLFKSAGSAAPFLASAAMLIVAFGFGFRVRAKRVRS